MQQELKEVEIRRIFVLNPRERNRHIAGEIKKNIEQVGLKRPITITRKAKPSDGYEYDLVCGQGRLEAFIANGQTKIPAIIVEASEEDALVMSLVENVARRQYQPCELYKSVKRLRDDGYSVSDIARKTGLSYEYISQIMKLMEKGEDRLINAVEANKIPLHIAIQIAEMPETEIQGALQDAYDKGMLRGHSLKELQKILATRRTNGKTMRERQGKSSPKDISRILQRELERKAAMVGKAHKVESELLFFRESFRTLAKDENFLNLIAAEKVGEVPQTVMDEVNGHE